MKKFKIHNKLKGLPFYIVSRTNREAYIFFSTEYHNLPKVNDNIIVPASEIEDRTVEKKDTIGTRIKKVFVPKNGPVYIGPGTETHTYFKSEYGSSYYDRSTDAYYVPEDKFKGKRR